eukprot:Protomagalhaensia_sp_Gyna_25__125@NODE_105_length_5226_cov_230_702911_g82_i0_p1_GENE_NODE_105_length_5226_cov_230_702911_g82_i0NODE_105_length_5226_cov_230_702911_g82_i0_p1_ORF_typecomplete_len617_score101_56GST_N/PF02798_20/6_2e09GST_N/PF02798_20/5_7e02GST_N/PF02798_20/7_1e03GST_N/PF02798_20/3_2e09GST_C_3/PF14497_6/8_5e05GST_C_3/PF14497_6/3_3e03GST_C_3/PF14497_6/6_3e12GST_N_3/PF13417_6/0_012GST_N_3/PF13417_6/1e04GST_N_3/PF13417_6/1_4e03GST_N_3/PF13417_6/6_5e08GST_N_4/PF17172_4/0_00024GST_N_4/PF
MRKHGPSPQTTTTEHWRGPPHGPREPPSLYYFDVAGRGEPIRFAFLLGGVEFRDVRIPMDDESWESHWRMRSPTGLCPWLEVDGQKIPESRALLMYAAKRGDLIPSSVELAAHAETVIDWLCKWFDEIKASVASLTKAEQYARFPVIITEALTTSKLEPLERLVASRQTDGFVAGPRVSHADCFLAAYVHFLSSSVTPELAAKFRRDCPALHRCRDTIYNLGPIQLYLRRHSPVKLHGQRDSWQVQWLMTILDTAGVKYEVDFVEQEFTHAPRFTNSPFSLLLTYGEEKIENFEPALQWVAERTSLVPKPAAQRAQTLDVANLIRETITTLCDATTIPADAAVTSLQTLVPKLKAIETESILSIGGSILFQVLVQSQVRPVIVDADLEVLESCYRRVYAHRRVKKGLLLREKPALYYFDVAIRAESQRFLLHAAGIPFNDIRFNGDEWRAKFKHLSPTGQCPFLILGGVIHVESLAILRLLAELTNLVPLTIHGVTVANMLASVYDRVWATNMRSYDIANGDQAVAKKYRQEHIPPQLDLWEKCVAQYTSHETQWTVEDRLTWIDFFIAGEMQTFIRGYDVISPDAARWPTLMKVYNQVMELPQIQEYHKGSSAPA